MSDKSAATAASPLISLADAIVCTLAVAGSSSWSSSVAFKGRPAEGQLKCFRSKLFYMDVQVFRLEVSVIRPHRQFMQTEITLNQMQPTSISLNSYEY